MTPDLVIGLDFGSDSVRGMLLTPKGEVLASESCDYPRWGDGFMRDDAAMLYRQHPADYFDAMTAVVRKLAEAVPPQRIAAIALDATGSTPGAVDRKGRSLALRPDFSQHPDAMFVLWKDHTAIEESELINRVAAEWPVDYRRFSGGIYSAEWFYSKILRIVRRSPAVADAAATFAECCDYLAGELSGNLEPRVLVRSRCGAAHKAMWHREWDGLPPRDFFDRIDPRLGEVRTRLFDRTVCAGTRIGHLAPVWAERFGVPASIIVGSGALDGHVGAAGAGARPGTLIKIAGTSGNDMLVAEHCEDAIPGICGQADGSIVPGLIGLEAGQAAIGDIFAWFRRLLEYSGQAVDLRRLEHDAAQIAPDAPVPLSLDFFAGRRTPSCNPHLAGALTGLVLGSSAPEIYLSLMRAVAFGTRAIHENYTAHGLPIDEVRIIGGVAAKSPLLLQILADVLQKEILLVDQEQCCALGAGMFAAVAAGIFPDFPSAQRAMAPGIRTVHRPDPGKRELYDTLYRRYLELADFEERRILQRG